jgi:hypothetical protein
LGGGDQGVGSLTSNPLLTDITGYTADSAKPLIGSPAISSGIQISTVTKDYDENNRLNPPNIGAYESLNSDGNSPPNPLNSGGGGGGGGGCFIATAAYKSTKTEEQQILYRFRDKCLLTNKLGREFVKFYYKVSPPISKYIGKRAWARSIVRGMLKPVVWVAKKTLENR